VVNTSRIPLGITRTQALAMLSDYEFFLACDPHLAKYDLVPPTETCNLNPPPFIPDNVQSQLRSPSSPPPPPSSEPGKDSEEKAEVRVPVCYRVTDIVHAIPGGVWDTNVVSTFEFTLIRDGLFVRIRSPLSIVMDTFWQIREVDEGGGDERKGNGKGKGKGLELVQDVTIQCSRLLIGFVKGQCENGWEGIHAKMIGRLEPTEM
ncbi:hypothetical protein C8A00DRAFT_11372, partial [Chaetomidium leptoderma]